MRAILEVKKGEHPYKIIRSPWLRDSDGPVLFKMLSKIRADGEIEAAYVVERRSGRKTVIAKTTTPENKFMDAISAFREAVWQQHPGADLHVEDVEPIKTDKPHKTAQYTAVRASKRGVFWLFVKKWLRWR